MEECEYNKTYDCYVVFIDIVAYSKESEKNQLFLVKKLNEQIKSNIRAYISDSIKLLYLPSGDGNAMVLYDNENAYQNIDPVQILSFCKYLIDDHTFQNRIRIGINFGKLRNYKDINGHEGMVGDTINMAARYMDSGNPGQIIVSDSFKKMFKEFSSDIEDREQGYHFKQYDVTVKHGIVVKINLLYFGKNYVIPKAAIQYKLGDFYPEFYECTDNITLTYYDNHHNSNIAIVLLHGLGLDSDDFYQFMRSSAYRCIAPNMYGCEPKSTYNGIVYLKEHFSMIGNFIKYHISMSEEFRAYEKILIVGFSLGADILFNLLSDDPEMYNDRFHYLLLDTNINNDTCFLSRQMARFSNDESILKQLEIIMQNQNEIDHWLKLARYFTQILSKFNNRINVIQQTSMDLITLVRKQEYFSGTLEKLFNKKEELSSLSYVRFIFSNDPEAQKILYEIEKYTKCPFKLVKSIDCNHFDLIEIERLNNIISDLVSDIENAEVYDYM